jgi:general stress protein 13
MPDKIEIGSILKGKVTSLKPYGAFVALDETHTGLVHISQVSHTFVKDIAQVLTVGQEVDVKVLSIDDATGKISLSIKETLPAPAENPERSKPRERSHESNRPKYSSSKPEGGFNTLEDKLKAWLKQSNEIQEDINKRNNR